MRLERIDFTVFSTKQGYRMELMMDPTNEKEFGKIRVMLKDPNVRDCWSSHFIGEPDELLKSIGSVFDFHHTEMTDKRKITQLVESFPWMNS